MIQIDSVTPSISDKSTQKASRAWTEVLRDPPGFWGLPEQDKMWHSVTDRATQLSGAEQVVVVGIGGSSLGARVLVGSGENPRRVVFLENTDPHAAEEIWKSLGEMSSTHWLWVSKSGSTLETLAHLSWVKDRFDRMGLSLADQSTVISDPGHNPLTDWAGTHRVPRLSVPPEVGGRFSVMTPVGLLPGALAGVNLSSVRSGARWAMSQDDLIISLAAAALDSWEREEWVTLFWGYANGLGTFSAWLQQLWAESLAKRTARTGHPAPRVSFPVPAVGSVDQHSILQQVIEGAHDKCVWLSRVSDLEMQGSAFESISKNIDYLGGLTLGQIFSAQAEGTASALRGEDVSTLVLRWRNHSSEALAGGMMLMEAVIACLGEALNIDAFDQPGVEAGKKLTIQILRNAIAARS